MMTETLQSAAGGDRLASNIAIYALKNVAAYYSREPLYPPEIHIFLKHRDAFYGKAALDLGVGTGRTSRYLAPCCARYVGVDLSSEMLALFGPTLPNTSLVECDMRRFRGRTDERFDFVLGSNSAFDALGHDDRLAMFGDLHAMTNPGALFAFSTHNRNWSGVGKGPELAASRDPVRLLRNLQEYRTGRRNHARMTPSEERHEAYAILNDVSHQWLALLYYVTRAEQTRQLGEAGFEVIEIYDRDGVILAAGADDSHCAILYYVCRRLD